MHNFFHEERIYKNYDAMLLKRLLTYAKPFQGQLIICIVLLLLIAFLDLSRPYLIKLLIDDYIPKKDIPGIHRMGLLYLFIIFSAFMLNYFQVYLLQYTSNKIIFNIRQEVFSHLQKMSLSFFDKNTVGRLVTRVTNDTEALSEMYTSVLVNLFKDLFIISGAIIVMIKLSFSLSLIVFSIFPFLVAGTILFARTVRPIYREVRTKLAKINSALNENIAGIKTIQIFRKEGYIYREFNKMNREYLDASNQQLKIYALFHPGIELLSTLGLTAILWYGGNQVLQHAMEFGVLFAFISYLKDFFRPIADMSEKYNILQAAMTSSERIFELLDTPADIPQPHHPVVMDTLEGVIEFKNVWFAYQPGEWVLKDVSFKINPGETIAIVGATGSGKSTIIHLLGRFYDIQQGEILIDGINIKDMDLNSLRCNMGMVLQDTFLFSGHMISNIRLNNPSITDEAVQNIAKYVNAHDFIQKLPKQYYEEVQERGSTLSLGQRQLIALARVLAYQPSILILDEATSNIDTETESLIQDAIKKILQGRTSIMIAHRLSTIQHAHRIIVMHKGQIRETGTHQELLEKRGIYYRLYQLQYKE
ncbi:ABC transporter ATP-binding protein [Thermotalea metallivorans]|uniref:Putative ABC transporter ATP-binding protein n=1 Tax=Thermotalea metallivorans TaxID=520762 RepID=A0A140L9H9_9FIRM|nr:ABC transporter ATP-binding protein [Thermotalea metallivorans]KXG77204.1 putative ABC transporter ATP-binding protein [Thermotalea metallivorans]